MTGVTTHSEGPQWTPLLNAIGDELTGWFMWMFAVQLVDGPLIHAYKHWATRRYVHLSASGGAFVYHGDGKYSPTPVVSGVLHALDGWDPHVPLLADWYAVLSLAAGMLSDEGDGSPAP